MTRLASFRLAPLRRTRAELMAKSALCSALTGAFGLIATSQAQAGSGPMQVTGLPVQAPTTPQVAGGHGNQPLVTVTGNTMTVGTDASRTLIDWNSFTVAQGNAVNFTFNTRSDIVLNRLVNSTPVMINGGLTGTVQGNIGGNVWFSAPGGVVFGSTAVVNVGGMLATTALVDVNSFLNPSNTSSFPFAYPGTGYPGATGYPAGTYFPGNVTYPAGSAYPAINGYPVSNVAGGVGGVTVMSGARLTAQGGLMALIAPFVNVAAGAVVQSTDQTQGGGGAGSVLYGSANAFTVSLSQETSGDLDMLQFVIDSPSQVTDNPLLLQGTTTGTNVYVAALTASGITGAVVDATGTLTATTASTGQGGEIILSTGSDTITAPSFTSGVFQPGGASSQLGLAYAPTDLEIGSTASGQDIQAASSGALNGVVNAGDTVLAGSDATLSAQGDLALYDVSTSTGTISLTGGSVSAGALNSGGSTEIQTLTNINPSGGVTVASLAAGGGVSITAAGGPVTVNSFLQADGGDVSINAGGDVTVVGSAFSEGNFSINAIDQNDVGLGAINTADISANGVISLQGASVSATSLAAYGFTEGPSIYVEAYAPSAQSGRGLAFVDIGSATAYGDITLTGDTGYASLGSVDFLSSGQTLNITADGFAPVYFGYGPGGPNANDGEGPTPGIGSVAGTGTINLSAGGDADLNVVSGSGLVTLGTVFTQGDANLTADALTVTGSVVSYYGTNVTAQTGDLNASELDSYFGDVNASATQGSVFLANTTANNVYVTAAQTAHVDNATTNGGPEDPIDVTGATAYLGTANSQDDINVTATNGSATAGDLTAGGAITVSATDGVASLHSANLYQNTDFPNGSSFPNTVSVMATGTGADVLIGDPAGTTASGFVTGATSINLQADEDVTVNVSQPLELNTVSAGRNVSLSAPSLILDNLQGNLTGDIAIAATGDSFSFANALTAGGDVTVTASGALTLGDVTSTGGSVTLTGVDGVSFGAGSAAQNFVATAITGAPGSGSGPGSGTGPITAGDVTATNGYIDLEGTNVSVGALTAGGVNSANNDYIYAAAWGDANSSPGTLSFTSTSPDYLNNAQVFLYPAPPPPPPPSVALPVQDSSAPFQFDTNGAAPTLGLGSTTETVTLNAKRTLIDWTSYQIGSGGEVDYVFTPVEGQNAANARGNIVLNRITGGGPVDIEGVLTSSVAGDTQAHGGNVWFSAPGGIVFGSGAVVNVGGLVATTAGFSPANLTSQFLDPTVFTFTLAGAGSGYPSGATGFPFGSGYPGGTGYPVDSSAIGVTVDGGAQISGSGSLVALVAPFVQVQSGAQVSDLDANGAGAASVLYAAAPSFTLTATQPGLGGDAVNGLGDIDFASLAIGTDDLSGYATPLTLQGTTNALNIYAAALSPSQVSGAVADATGPLSATLSASGAGGEIILSTGADTLAAGQTPTLSTASIAPLQLNLDTVTAAGPLRILSSGAIIAAADPAGLLQSSGDMTLAAGGDISLASVRAGGNLTVAATTPDPYGGVYGAGNITANALAAGLSVDLEGASVTANTVTAGTAGAGAITANAYDNPSYSNSGAASVDIGSAAASGDISLYGNDGYASLTNVTFTGAGQTLTLSGYGYAGGEGAGEPVYLGYSSGGPNADNGAGPTGGVGSVTGSGTINLTSRGDANLDVAPGSGLVTVGAVDAGGAANLTADALTITGVVQSFSGVTATARTGDLNAQELDADFGDVNASATQGSVFLASTTANNVYVTAAQTAHVDNATTNGGPEDPIDVTGATAFLGAANSQDDINVTATNGNATAGDLTAQGAVSVTATNGVASLHSATLTSGTSYPSGSTYPNTVSVSATGTGADVLIGDPAGAVATGFVTGATSITAQADQDVTVNVSQPIELNTVSAGRNASLTAPSLTLDTLQGNLTGDIAITVTNDAFSYANPLTAGRSVTIAATDGLTLGDVTANGGDIALTSTTTEIAPGSGALTTVGTGPISVGAVNASGALTVAGLSVTASSLTAGSTADIEADTADMNTGATSQIDIGTLEAGGAITVAAGGGYASITNLMLDGSDASLNLTASGAVYLGYASGGTGAGAGSGSIAGSGAISLTGGGDVDVDVPGAVTLANVNATTTSANLTADSLTLGFVSAARGINLTANTGDLIVTGQATSVYGDNAINATATLGDVNLAYAAGPNIYVLAGGLAQVGAADNTRFGADDTTRVIQVTGASVALGGATSQNTVTATASNGPATVGGVTAGGDVSVSATGGSASLGDVTGQGGVSVTATGGAASLHSASLSPAASGTGFPNTVSVSATGAGATSAGADVLIGGPDAYGNIGFVTGATSITAQADEDVTVNVNQPLALNTVSAGRTVSLTAPSLTLDTLQGNLTGDIAITVTNDAFSYTTPLTAGGQVSVSASGGLTLGDVTAQNGQVSLAGAGVNAGAVNATGGITLGSTGGDIVLSGDATAGGTLLATATGVDAQGNTTGLGAISLANATAAVISLAGSSVTAASLTANGSDGNGASITAAAYDPPSQTGGAFVDVGSVSAPGNITLTANDGYASLTTAAFTGSGQTLSVSSQGGAAVYLGYGQGGPDANDGAGPTAAQGGLPTTGTVNLSSGGDVDVSLASAALLARVSAAGGVNITSPSQITVSQDLIAGGDVAMTTPGFITLQGVTSRAGSVFLTGGTGIELHGPGQAADDFVATAINGYTPGAGTVAHPSVGSGAITTGDVTATNGYVDLEGTNLTVGALTAGGVNPANNDYIYGAAWGTAHAAPGVLRFASTNPDYVNNPQVFLYPTPNPATPPPAVALPEQDASSPFRFDSNGAAPTIGAAGALADGNTGETITLNAKRTLIDWTSYTIGSGGEVDYVFTPVEGQNAANARGNIVLNRITGGGPVDIEGVLTSSVAGDTQAHGGNVWFSAPGGIVFGSGAVVNVGGLVATTAGFSPANLTSQFLDPTVFTFTLAGAGSGYPSGATGFPFGSGYPGGTGYPVDSSAIGVTVDGGAQISGSGSLVALVAPFVQVQSGAQVSDLDANGAGAASVLYAAAPSFTLTATQPGLGGDAVNGLGDIDFASLAIGTDDLSGYATPLTLQGTTNALNIYAAALSPSQVSGAVADATGPLSATLSASGAGGEIILSTGADTLAAGQTPTLSTASIAPLQLNLDTVTAAGPLRILSSGAIIAAADPAGLLQSSGDMTLAAGGDISLASVRAGGNLTVAATTPDPYGGVYGAGNITANALAAGLSVDLEGASVTANTVTAGTAGAGAITANAYDNPSYSNSGAASVDIGSAAASGDISLYGNDGYASLTNVTFTGAGQTLTLSGYGYAGGEGAGEPVYLGYSSGGPNADNGAGPTGGVGSVTGSGTINLTSRGDANLDVAPGSGLVTVGAVDAGGAANLTADALTITGVVQSFSGVTATARTGDLNAQELDADFGDVNASATQGSVFLASTTANNVYVTAAQTAHVDNATTNGGPEDPIDVTGATAFLGAANSQDDINVTATNGNATAGDLTAQGAVSVTATNGVASLHSATLTSGTSYPSGSTYPNTVSVSATGTGADVLIGDPAGAVATGFITGATSITAQADEDVTVNVNQPLALNTVSAGRTVSLTAPSLTLDTLQGNLTGDIAITVTNDAFSYANPLTAGRSVTIAATDGLTLQDVTAQTGDVALEASRAITVGNLTSSAGQIGVSGASVTAGAIASTGGDTRVTAQAGNVSIASLTSGRAVAVSAPMGGISLASTLQANGGDAVLTGGGDIHLGGAASASGNFLVSTQTNNGASAVGAISASSITAGGGLDLEGTNIQADTLQAQANLSNGYAVTAHAYADGSNAGDASVRVGAVTSPGGVRLISDDGVIASGAISAGDVLLIGSGGGITLTGPVTATGNVYAGTQSAGSALGAVSVGAVSAGGGIDLEGSSVQARSLVAQGVDASGYSVTAHAYERTDASNAGDAFIQINSATGPSGVRMFADDGAITVGSLKAGATIDLEGSSVYAASLVSSGTDGSGTSITANAHARNDGSNAGAAFVDIGAVAAPGNITLAAADGYASLTSASFTGPNGGAGQTLTLASTGSPQTVYLGYGQGGTGANGGQGQVTGAGTIELTSNGGVSVDAAGAVALDQVTARGAVNITADSVTANAINNTADDFGGTVNVSARMGDINLGTLEAVYGPVSLSAPGAVNAGVVVGQGIGITAGGVADIDYLSTIIAVSNASGSYDQAYSTSAPVQITGAQVILNQGFSLGAFTLKATNGAATIGDIEFGGGPVSISAVNGVASLHSARPDGANIDFTDQGDLPAPQPSDISVTASGAGADVLIGGMSNAGRFPGLGLVQGAASLTVQAAEDVTVNVGGALALTSVQAGRNASVSADALTLGTLVANQDATLTTPNLAAISLALTPTLSANSVSAGRDLTIVAGGALSLGSVSAGRNLSLTGPSVSLASVSDQPSGAIALTATAGGFTSTSALTGSAIDITAAGPVTLGAVTALGGDVDISSQGAASVGDVAAAGNILLAANGGSATLHSATLAGGAGTLTITASGATSDISLGQGTGFIQGAVGIALQAGEDITVALSGPLTLTSAQAGRDLSLSGGAIQAASLTSGRDTLLTGAGVSVTAGQVGRNLTLNSTSGVTLGSITVGGALGLDAVGLASLGSVSVTDAGRVTAGGLDIATLLSAPTLTIEARNGALTVGGSTAPTDGALWISEAEFTRLNASTSLALYAGSTTGTARGALVVSDLSLDPAVTPKLSLYAAPGQTVSVTGAVTPTVSGGTVDIGSTTDAAWTPSTILVSGAIGAATRVNDASFTGVHAFQQVTLSSGGDVLIGSPRFFGLVQATPASGINIALNQPSGATATGAEIGKVYVTTGQLNIDATGKVVQQNSSGSATSYSGLYLLNGVSASKTALSIDPPSVVDLFGSFVNTTGVLTSGAQASRSTGLQLLGLPGTGQVVPSDYRFNGCTIDAVAACGSTVGPEQGFQLGLELAQEFAAVAAATTDPQLLTQSVLLTIAPTLQIEEQLDPLVTGVGNEEIWRKRKPADSEANDR